MLQDQAHLALWVGMQDKSRLNMDALSKSVCQFGSTVQSPPTTPTWPPNRTPTSTVTMFKAGHLPQLGLFRLAKWLSPLWLPLHLPLFNHPLIPLQHHPFLPLPAPPQSVPRAEFPMPVLVPVPTSPAGLHPPSRGLGPGPITPAPPQTLCPTQARGGAPPQPLFVVAMVISTALVAQRPSNYFFGSDLATYTQHPECGSRCQSFYRKYGLEGGITGGT